MLRGRIHFACVRRPGLAARLGSTQRIREESLQEIGNPIEEEEHLMGIANLLAGDATLRGVYGIVEEMVDRHIR